MQNGTSLKLDELIGDGHEMILKINKKLPKVPKEQSFRSFRLDMEGSALYFFDKPRYVHLPAIFEFLKNHGLPSTVPVVFKPKGDEFGFVTFDPEPYLFDGPKVFPFKWKATNCSFTTRLSPSGSSLMLYFRVHDMTDGVGEKIMVELLNELEEEHGVDMPKGMDVERYISLHSTQQTRDGFSWTRSSARLRRSFDTIYLDVTIKKRLIDQLEKFLRSENLYNQYGVTWKRVHLFYGAPGTGKSSTVLSLASHFGKDVAKLTVTPDMNSQQLERLFKDMPENSFVLVEDVDCLFTANRTTTGSASAVDFSTVLNCMDGLLTKRGLVLFMTTNHLDRLEEAFVRPGRVDCKQEFTAPGEPELRQALSVLGKRFASEHDQFIQKHGKTGMRIPDLQKHIFECLMDEKESILS